MWGMNNNKKIYQQIKKWRLNTINPRTIWICLCFVLNNRKLNSQLTWLDILDIEILLLLKLFTMLFSDCRCRGDFGLLGIRFMGDIGGECNEGVKLPLLLLKLRLLLCEPPLASCVENEPFWFMGGCCLPLPCCSFRLNGIVLGVGAAGNIFCLIVIIFCPFGSSYKQLNNYELSFVF